MTLKMTTRYCMGCDRSTLHLRNGVDHAFHLVASILTGGLWLIGWLIVAGTADRRELCVHCSTMLGASRVREPGTRGRVVDAEAVAE